MIRKQDGGYVMAFVLIVIVVLCIVAVSMMTVSLRNVQAQADSIQRMQDKYAAMGEIEKLVAKIENSTMSISAAEGAVRTQCVEYLNAKGVIISDTLLDSATSGYAYNQTKNEIIISFPITCSYHSVALTCGIAWRCKVSQTGTEGYLITDPVVTYTSYEISTVGVGG